MVTFAGFIRSNLELIEKLQFEGYSLEQIYQKICGNYQKEVNFNLFIVSLYRARKSKIKLNKINTTNAVIEKNIKQNLKTTKEKTNKQNTKNVVKQIRQIFKDSTDISEFL